MAGRAQTRLERDRPVEMTLCLHRARTEHWFALWCNHVQAYGAYVNAKGVQAGRTATPLAMAAYAKQSQMEQFLKSRGGV
jgi:hypothetical protein